MWVPSKEAMPEPGKRDGLGSETGWAQLGSANGPEGVHRVGGGAGQEPMPRGVGIVGGQGVVELSMEISGAPG